MKPIYFQPTKKEINILAILVFIIVCAMCSCSKSVDKPTPATPAAASVTLYSSRVGVSLDGVTLAISGKVVGGLQYSASAPDCGAQGFATVTLTAGTYAVSYMPYNSNGAATKTVSIKVAANTGTCQTFDLK